jgi:hypothetical protein
MFLHGKGIGESLAGADFGVKGMKLTSAARDSTTTSSSSSSTATVTATATAKSSSLPPSPADSFVEGTFGMDIETGRDVHVLPTAASTRNGDINAAVLTGYRNNIEEVNKFFQTSHDDLKQLRLDDLTRTATTIARTLYALATVENLNDATALQSAVASSNAKQLQADPLLVEKLVNCSVVSWDCSLTKTYSPHFIDIARGKIKNAKVNLSPNRRLQYLWAQNGRYVATPQVTVIREFLADVTVSPEHVGRDCGGTYMNEQCRINVTGYECVRGRCIQPSAWYHWATKVDDKSAWSASATYINYKITVPGSTSPAVEVYRRASVGSDIVMLFVGLLVSILSIIGSKWLISRNDKFNLITKTSL